MACPASSITDRLLTSVKVLAAVPRAYRGTGPVKEFRDYLRMIDPAE
jgi:hypothetical protein